MTNRSGFGGSDGPGDLAITPLRNWLIANPAVVRLLGKSLGELYGQDVRRLLPPGVLSGDVLTLPERCQPLEREIILPDESGKTRVLALSASLAAGGRLGQQRIILAFLDVTARKQAEEKLKAMYAGLEDMVAERTQELTEANQRLLAAMDIGRRYQEDLAASEAKYRHLFDHAPDAVLLLSIQSEDSIRQT